MAATDSRAIASPTNRDRSRAPLMLGMVAYCEAELSNLALLVSDTGRAHNPSVTDDVLENELRAALEARQELGDEMEPAIIDAFVARIEQRLGDRVDDRERALKRRRDHQKDMTLGAMAISVPLLAIAAIFTGLPGVIAVCVALAVIAIVSGRSD